jgi:hypothetical protein
MAAKYDWGDGKGKVHSISLAQHKANMQQASPLGKGLPASAAPVPPPPVGTYDPAVDYNASGSQRGYTQLANDAQTLFEQGTEDYGLQTADNKRQFGILGRQQDESAAQRGIMSQGLLAKSDAVRGENQQRQQSLLDTGFNRVFAGYQPLTAGQRPEAGPGAGSLLKSLSRGWIENDAFQNFSAGQRTSQAAANNYTPPTPVESSEAQRKRQARRFRNTQNARLH